LYWILATRSEDVLVKSHSSLVLNGYFGADWMGVGAL
jgi:hypothetical protein